MSAVFHAEAGVLNDDCLPMVHQSVDPGEC